MGALPVNIVDGDVDHDEHHDRLHNAFNRHWIELTDTDYGLDEDVADNTAVFTAAAAALGGTAGPGGQMHVPRNTGAKHYDCTGSISFDDMPSIAVVGDGTMGSPCSRIRYTGAGARFISARSSYGLRLVGLGIYYSNAAFAGFTIDYTRLVAPIHGDTFGGLIEDCKVGSENGTLHTSLLVSWANALMMTARKTYFSGGTQGIRGRGVAGDFSNANTVEGCWFDNMVTAAIVNPYTGWVIQGNVAEPLTSGAAGFIANSLLAPTQLGIVIIGNWCGDNTAGGTWIQLTDGQAIVISGNYLAGDATTHCIKFGDNNSKGVVIEGNTMSGLIGIDFGASTGHTRLFIVGNANSAATRLGGTIPIHWSSIIQGDDLYVGTTKFNGSSVVGETDFARNMDNFVRVQGAGTPTPPNISAQGSDTNIHLELRGKGTGSVRLNYNGGTGGISVGDGAGNEAFSVNANGNIVKLAKQNTQILSASGAPSSSAPNGSIYLRTDGTGPNLYVRENGAWVSK